MFPNVRLMVVAILAAIAGISCGLGLFATFRVNHEPLARLAEGSPPMQLAVDNLTLRSNALAAMEARLPVTGLAKTISVPVIVPTPEPAAADQAGADATVATELASVQQAETGPEATEQSNTANPAVAVQTEPPSMNPEAGGAAATDQTNTANPVVAVQEPPSLNPETAGAAATDLSNTAPTPVAAVQTEPSSATAEAASAPPSQQDVIATAQEQTPAVSAAAASSGEQTAAISAAAPNQAPALKPTKATASKAPASKKAKPKAKASRPAAPARRAIKTVRARRTVTTIAAQSAYPYSQPTYSQSAYSLYSQPTYTWMNGAAQASQPVKRVQIKRSRVLKQAAPVAQSIPSASTAGLSGTQ